MFVLTNQQEERYEAVKWLLDEGPVGSGRTTLMALVFIEIAFDNQNQYIKVFDHYRKGNKNLLAMIEKVFSQLDGVEEYELLYNHHEFEIKMRKKV